jgi:hypothetical protein
MLPSGREESRELLTHPPPRPSSCRLVFGPLHRHNNNNPAAHHQASKATTTSSRRYRKANIMFILTKKIALAAAAAMLLLLGLDESAQNVAVAAAVPSMEDAVAADADAIDIVESRRRHLELLHRLLQDSGSNSSTSSACQAEAEAAQACLDANVGDANSTAGGACLDCYFLKQSEALDDFRNNPTIECNALNDNVCTPVSECTCLERCDNEVSAMADCSLKDAFEGSGIALNCTIACEGTNVTVAEDDVEANRNDNFVGGLCEGEEAAVKLCLETMESSLQECVACLDATTTPFNVTTSTTCSEIQGETCERINACPCVEDCRAEFVDMWNCDIDFSILDFPQLETCDQLATCPAGSSGSVGPSSGGGSSSSTGTSGAMIIGPAAAASGFLAVVTTLAVAHSVATVFN